MKEHKKTSAAAERQTREASRQTTISGMENGVHWEEKILSPAGLYSGQPYQRPVLDRDVDKLVREWDPRLLTLLSGGRPAPCLRQQEKEQWKGRGYALSGLLRPDV